MQRRQLAKIAATSFGGGGLPPHISILGGRFTLVDGAGNRRPLTTLHMDCVIVDLNEKMTRMFWGVDEQGQLKGFDAEATAPPACFSDNGVAPSSRALEPQAKTCTPDRTHTNGCKWSVWGSAISKRDGKTKIPACQNGIKTAILVAQVKQAANGGIEAIDVMPMAFMLRVPPNSIDAFKSYGKEIGGYGEVELPWTGQKENLDLPLVVTRVSFEEGEVGKLQFKPLGYINGEVDEIITQLDDKTVDNLVGRDDVPWDGALIGTKPQPQISPAQGQALLKVAEATSSIPMPFPAPQVPANEPPKPRGRPRKAAAEPAPAPFAAPAQPLPADGSIPPFLQREPVKETSPNNGQKSQPAFGIQQAPPPNAELDKMLSDAFGLPTK
jgi:hypothetical protein